jgi:alkylated DNA nucleotide flippase Atl1
VPNYYPENADMATRAAQAWPILAMVAHQQSTMTYGQLAGLLGMHQRPIRFVLGHIMVYCA